MFGRGYYFDRHWVGKRILEPCFNPLDIETDTNYTELKRLGMGIWSYPLHFPSAAL